MNMLSSDQSMKYLPARIIGNSTTDHKGF